MAHYKDSVGNTYSSLPTRPPTHTAKSTTKKETRASRRKRVKYQRYRARKGKPNGPGVAGNKAGKNRITR